MTCINCNTEHSSPFCPQCGEKAGVPTITFRSVFRDGLSTLTNMDKGFLYNVKNLLLRPQATVEAYIEGRRKGIFNPISFLVLAVTLYLLVDAYVGAEGVSRDGYSGKVYEVGLEAGRFVRVYFKYFWILSVAWMSFSTKLIFGKYNLAEVVLFALDLLDVAFYRRPIFQGDVSRFTTQSLMSNALCGFPTLFHVPAPKPNPPAVSPHKLQPLYYPRWPGPPNGPLAAGQSAKSYPSASFEYVTALSATVPNTAVSLPIH
ncbi:MAG: DUF3667 domain-containing protein [Bacteroidetes bacterium]|nr:DUF3667 domain-containing protein [Bacteroidota bacterium]